MNTEKADASAEETIFAWRITSRAYAESALNGEGARRYGGRWNSEGVPMVYLAGLPSLGALEQLVHLSRMKLLEGQFVRFCVEIPAGHVLQLDPDTLPDDWTNRPETTRALGDGWAASEDALALRVPSAVVSEEANLLLNPNHPDMEVLKIGSPEPFAFDERLLR